VTRSLYRKRFLVEIFFHNLKRFRAIATRYEKTARNYLALVQLACARLWLEN
jgi:transposase